ncbi:MAG: glycosyltransferase family 2 protein [Caldilineaceae bacterium]|nr:glycosyltransferase family 2 protein [Caldilineaceae bacterium]
MNNIESANPRCSVIIVGYNSAADLRPLLAMLTARLEPDVELILVDNASTDETAQVAADYAPQVRYEKLAQNIGFAGGNNAGAALARGDILIFLNPDTMPHAGWLNELVRPLLEKEVGMSTARIIHARRPHLINTCGNDITWTGLTVCRGLDQPVDLWDTPDEVAAVSGACFAIRRSLFKELNGFDERFFLYYEDTDLSLRVRLAGYRIVYAPRAVVAHRYVFKFSAQKAYYQERNRWLALLKTLRWPTLLLLLPGLLLGELMAWCYAGLNGRDHVRAKARGWRWLCRNHALIRQARRETFAQRRTSDAALLRHWSPTLRFTGTVPDTVAYVLEGAAYWLLRAYGGFCRRVAVW